jgi:hypothetical protein
MAPQGRSMLTADPVHSRTSDPADTGSGDIVLRGALGHEYPEREAQHDRAATIHGSDNAGFRSTDRCPRESERFHWFQVLKRGSRISTRPSAGGSTDPAASSGVPSCRRKREAQPPNVGVEASLVEDLVQSRIRKDATDFSEDPGSPPDRPLLRLSLALSHCHAHSVIEADRNIYIKYPISGTFTTDCQPDYPPSWRVSAPSLRPNSSY